MAKAPVAGSVKTRCCPPCDPRQAAALAEAALADTLESVAASSAELAVLALEGEPGAWIPAEFVVLPQHGRGLGDRIDRAVHDIDRPALVIGMDTPQVDVTTLDGALDLLRGAATDALVGPAADGGFWALGLTRPIAGLCASVPMSVPTTCVRLLDELHATGHSWHDLDELIDIDDFATARRVAAMNPSSRLAGAVALITSQLAAESHIVGAAR